MGWLVVVLCSLILETMNQEEAVLLDGQRRSGMIVVPRAGHLQFAPADGSSPLELDQVAQVRFPRWNLPPLRIAAAHRVTLPGGQFLTGEFLSLDEKQLRMRTAWAGELSIPRDRVLSILHAPGYATFFQDNFEGDLKAWKLTGQPSLSNRQHTSGRHSLCLDACGQIAEYKLPKPLRAGRAGINFCADEQPKGARWTVDAEFDGTRMHQPVQVIVAGDSEGYKALIAGTASPIRGLRLTPGWHRLTLEFSERIISVAIDEDILWTSSRPAPGLLRTIRLACVPRSEEGMLRGNVWFDDFSLARSMRDAPRPDGDPTQDELWLLSGDQLFGRVLRADRSAIGLQRTPGTRPYQWGSIRGIFFRQPMAPRQKGDNQAVRLWLRSGLDTEADELVGQIRFLDSSRMRLKHPALGEVEFSRSYLHRLRLDSGIEPP
jgi:hypothetical protein